MNPSTRLIDFERQDCTRKLVQKTKGLIITSNTVLHSNLTRVQHRQHAEFSLMESMPASRLRKWFIHPQDSDQLHRFCTMQQAVHHPRSPKMPRPCMRIHRNLHPRCKCLETWALHIYVISKTNNVSRPRRINIYTPADTSEPFLSDELLSVSVYAGTLRAWEVILWSWIASATQVSFSAPHISWDWGRGIRYDSRTQCDYCRRLNSFLKFVSSVPFKSRQGPIRQTPFLEYISASPPCDTCSSSLDAGWEEDFSVFSATSGDCVPGSSNFISISFP